jgi:uncharacterized hydrophobic protein (TIGR00271 family)
MRLLPGNVFETLFRNVSNEEREAAVAAVIQHASPRPDFFLMLMLAVSMAAFAILLDSMVVLVGSMLIAPLLYPILSLALGVIVADEKLIGRSLYTIGKSVLLSLLAGVIIGLLFSAHVAVTTLPFTVVSSPPSLMYALIAAIAGFAAAFAMIKPHLNDTLPGVAISVSLVPPLAAAGVALSVFDWTSFSNALLLFLVNVIGIVFSAMIVFALFHFSTERTVAHEAVKADDREMKKEGIA